jgi:hypothetical protein
MVVGLCGALATAHRAGVVHGHLSADDIVTSAYGTPQLAGFGLHESAREAPRDVADLATICRAALGEQPDVPQPLRDLLDAAVRGEAGTAEQLGRSAQQLQRQLGVAVTPLQLAGDVLSGSVDPEPRVRRDRRKGALLVAVLSMVVVAALLAVRPVPAPDDHAGLEQVLGPVGGPWEADLALAAQLRSSPDAYLCHDLPTGFAQPLQVVATRSSGGDTRVAVVLRRYPPDAAPALRDELAAQAQCLAQTSGLTGVTTEAFVAGEEAIGVRYRRPAAQAPVEIVVLTARRDSLVAQAVHLGYPRAAAAVTRDLRGELDRLLDEQR